MAAAFFKTQEIALEPAEAKQLAEAYAGVARHYPILQQSEKSIDWFNFLSAVGFIYGVRAVTIMNNRRTARMKAEESKIINPGGLKVV